MSSRRPPVPRPSRRLVALVAALALAGPLAACSSGNASSGGSTVNNSPITNAYDQGTTAAAPSTAPVATPVGGAVTFAGVTVTNPTDLTKAPGITSATTTPAPGLLVEDTVIGTGAAASPASTVEVQYVGALYKDGTVFDSSWANGGPATFALSRVVSGFLLGIGGTDGVEPMKVGGRRIMVFPASLGYADQANGSIPAGSSLVFVVDLTKVS